MAAELTNEEIREWVSELYRDEDLDEECLELLNETSRVYREPMFKDVYASCKKEGRDGSVFNDYLQENFGYGSNLPSDYRFQITAFHTACLSDDFVFVDAMVRLGADYERLTGRGDTALTMVCKMITTDRHHRRNAHPGRIRIIRRLLELGVDPNIGCPLQYACDQNEMTVCALLLANGADPRKLADDGRLPKEHLAAPLRRRFLKLPKGPCRAEPLCWCLTSGRLLKDCHGKEDGRTVDPMFGCPCKSGKTYGKCCKKRGIKFKETRDHVFELRQAVFAKDNPLPVVMEKLKERMGPDEPIWTGELYAEAQKKVARELRSKVDPSQFDPAFAYAMENTNFEPVYWRFSLPKNEQLVRQKEWNAAVDEYIASNRVEGDTRTVREIEECAKIGSDGAALYKTCCYCQSAKEQREKEFSLCSQCKVRVYCSKACQKADWKEGHKHKCDPSEEPCPLHLPSQKTIDEYTKGELGRMMQDLSMAENA